MLWLVEPAVHEGVRAARGQLAEKRHVGLCIDLASPLRIFDELCVHRVGMPHTSVVIDQRLG